MGLDGPEDHGKLLACRVKISADVLDLLRYLGAQPPLPPERGGGHYPCMKAGGLNDLSSRGYKLFFWHLRPDGSLPCFNGAYGQRVLVDLRTGAWTQPDAGVGRGIDSFYEYMLKVHLPLHFPCSTSLSPLPLLMEPPC